MLNGLFSTFSGKFVNSRRLEIISNNIANVSTPGFKVSRPVFNAFTGEDESGNGMLQNTFVSMYDSYVNFAAAPMLETGSNLDFAIEGNGFFVVSTKDGPMYTRNGKFTINPDKKLVTAEGDPVLGKGGEITIDGEEFFVENDGSVFVGNASENKAFIDTIKIVDFEEKKYLRNYGKNLFVNIQEGAVEIIPENSTIRQGYYEASNVDIMREMIEMIHTIRAYEAYTKMGESLDSVLGQLIDLTRL
ncbi:MAG TPA: flagellar basal-body rod protein FlgF [Syntrophorhabdus sp.]|jgi:flagellar basal-body rod protein FlgG|nr:flagellar basal-body rod protein FlgF [Syntrophorhabdus sp.]MDI9557148.1 flagellar basal-body rod protein FlgF [Pseudomonadota bacterium]OPX94440.1 MAG: Flagellar basal-body rod protein FlgG [Syntrophorhabdus sp. PtaB.Bin027]OQB77989.1 MAG: Flagellar basal-body rod protein FlgG [Deltaproteobacteria bacterium ADurb.Bin135]MBP8743727.1 flagellar basal-body rod protein FlgF [Syntrophorhabdus sp.]